MMSDNTHKERGYLEDELLPLRPALLHARTPLLFCFGFRSSCVPLPPRFYGAAPRALAYPRSSHQHAPAAGVQRCAASSPGGPSRLLPEETAAQRLNTGGSSEQGQGAAAIGSARRHTHTEAIAANRSPPPRMPVASCKGYLQEYPLFLSKLLSGDSPDWFR